MPRILVIDDSETVRESFKLQFEKGPYALKFATNGLEAIEVLKNDKNFDLIICDLFMDHMNGIEFVKAQDSDESINHIPTVIMTSRFNPQFLKDIKEVNVVKSWLVKPFKPEQLTLLIQNIIDNKQDQKAS
ncbi:MAG: hypothetical protein CME68_09095 [Halobacteriovoraceae bacterium]|nr:hypothetical protein [Halobacteriovoraceae bacterium]